jgi:hypothetical protein
VATKAQIAAVEALVRESVGNVDRMAPESLRAVLPALRQAREELQRDLGEWVATVDNGADRFTAYEKTRALRALDGALDRVRELGPAVAQGLAVGRKATGALSISNLDTEIARLSSIFGDGLVVMPQIDTAAILARGERVLWKQHARSAARYAGNVGDDIRHLFAVGLAKHETFEQLVTRLRRVGGGRGVGLAGDASGEIADGLFRRYKFQADRLVRTELMHAYNVQHSDAIEAVNELRPEDEDPWLRRWDAAADVVTCPLCKELDHTVTTIEGVFRYGIKNPPAHPHCRCVVLAWLARWGGIKGETPHRGELPPVPPRKVKPRPASQEETPALRSALGWSFDSQRAITTPTGDFTERMLKRGSKKRVAVAAQNLPRRPDAVAPVVIHEDTAPKKNPKRVAAARKAAEASAERRREIYSAVQSNLSQELQVAWGQEGHKFMREEAHRVRGMKDRINAASELSQAFAEKYGSGEQAVFGNEGDRFYKRAEIEAKHAAQWADEQERKYYEAAHKEALRNGEINERGELLKPLDKAKRHDWRPPNTDDDDPPF